MKKCQSIKRIFKGIYNNGDKFEMISSLKYITTKMSKPKTYAHSSFLNKVFKYSIFNSSVKCSPAKMNLNFDEHSSKVNCDKTNEYSNEIKEVRKFIFLKNSQKFNDKVMSIIDGSCLRCNGNDDSNVELEHINNEKEKENENLFKFENLINDPKNYDVKYEEISIFNFIDKLIEIFVGIVSKGNHNENLRNRLSIYNKCLCNLYIGNFLHNKLMNNINDKTNLIILKGDYFFSLGYYSVSKLKNRELIKAYSQISENLSYVRMF